MADGAAGLPEHAPYDRIIFTVGAGDVAVKISTSLPPASAWSCRCVSASTSRSFAFECDGGTWKTVSCGGAAVLVGMAAADATGAFNLFDLADQGKRILGCNYGSSVGAIDISKLARLYQASRLPLDELIGNVRPLDEAAAASEDLKSAVGTRTVLEL